MVHGEAARLVVSVGNISPADGQDTVHHLSGEQLKQRSEIQLFYHFTDERAKGTRVVDPAVARDFGDGRC
jgi:hypothetical protein